MSAKKTPTSEKPAVPPNNLEPARQRLLELQRKSERMTFKECCLKLAQYEYRVIGTLEEDHPGGLGVMTDNLMLKGVQHVYAEQQFIEELLSDDSEARKLEGSDIIPTSAAVRERIVGAIGALFRIEGAIRALPQAISKRGENHVHVDMLLDELYEACAVGRMVMTDDREEGLMTILSMKHEDWSDWDERYEIYREQHRAELKARGAA